MRRKSSENVLNISRLEIPGENRFAQSIQILEVTEWIATLADFGIIKDSNEATLHPIASMPHLELKPSTLVHNIASSITSAGKFPCTRLVEQMIRYADVMSHLHRQLRNGVISAVFGSLVWVVASSTMEQLLIVIYGLYDINDENDMSCSGMRKLLSDIIMNEEVTKKPEELTKQFSNNDTVSK